VDKELQHVLDEMRANVDRMAALLEVKDDACPDEGGAPPEESPEEPVCVPRALPEEMLLESAANAAEVFPANSPAMNPFVQGALAAPLDPLQIAVMTTKWWGPRTRVLEVRFLDNPTASLRKRILTHMNAWECGITFRETRADGQVRISRDYGGYWSYPGTDVLLIKSGATMNLEGFTDKTPESEFLRVVRHEAGHTLGCPHEHMRAQLVARVNREKAYAYFHRTQGWGRQTVDQQVLTPLSERSIFGTANAEEDSIMCYMLPGSITKDGRPIKGGSDITASDKKFIQGIYPRR
jgi:hypothetical protein